MNKKINDSRTLIAVEATEWIIRLAEGEINSATTDTNEDAINPNHKKLLDWLQSSPQHVEEFLLATALWQELNALNSGHENKDQAQLNREINKLISASQSNIVPMDQMAPGNSAQGRELLGETEPLTDCVPRPIRHYRPGNRQAIKSGSINQEARLGAQGILGGCAILLLIIGLFLWVKPDGNYFETGHGEQRLLTLTDGSVIHLNTQSAVSVTINDSERKISLVRGEAMFQVAKDPIRPFRVKTIAATVEAIGTEFNIYQYDRTTSITVVEGQVAIQSSLASVSQPDQSATIPIGPDQTAKPTESGNKTTVIQVAKVDKALLLSAGEELRFEKNGRLTRINNSDIEKNIAWKNRRIVFRGDTLKTVAEDFNRYNHKKIIIQLPEQFSRKITGNFHTSDPESFITFLERDPLLIVTHNKDSFVIEPNNK